MEKRRKDEDDELLDLIREIMMHQTEAEERREEGKDGQTFSILE